MNKKISILLPIFIILNILFTACNNTGFDNKLITDKISKSRIVNADEAITINNKKYVKNEEIPFTGIIREYKNNNIKRDMEFKNGRQDGITVIYHKNGNISSFANFVNGIPKGESRAYYQTGELKLITYAGSKGENGIRRIYYKNGNIKSETPYKNNRKHGIQKKYYESGKLESEIEYINGQKFFNAKFYDEGGKLTRHYYFSHDAMLERKDFEYYKNGKIKTETLYENKEASSYGVNTYSEVKYYSEDGKLENISITQIPFKYTSKDLGSRTLLKDEKIIDEENLEKLIEE